MKGGGEGENLPLPQTPAASYPITAKGMGSIIGGRD